ncbi:MAG: indole-3-glycerol-phosphate synthase [Woeseiaceae bacterium]
MSDFLEQMAALSAERAAVAGTFASSDFDKPVNDLELGEFDIFAEIKDRSPAEGELAMQSSDRATRAKQYAAAGAAAISVLTEPDQFDGTLAHLAEIVAAVPDTPVMRKDFLVDTSQVLEARAAGASGVLLIVAMLGDAKLREMLDCAYEHNMFVLLEAFDEADVERMRALIFSADEKQAEVGKLLFGVNTRNLRTLTVDPHRLEQLILTLPDGRCVAESGLRTADHAAQVADMGYSIALVGTALMRSSDPGALVADMREAGVRSIAE